MIKRMEKLDLWKENKMKRTKEYLGFLTDKGLEICNKVEEFNKELEREFF